MNVDEAYAHIEKAVLSGRPANAYLIAGALRGMGKELVERVLHLLFDRENPWKSPDLHRVSPELKTRVISVDAMRSQIIAPLETTSYEGGWKVGLVYGADRLNDNASNAFLKTLEEPPPKTLLLLVSDNPERLLPTIVSRCQRIDLADAASSKIPEPWYSRTLAALADDGACGIAAKTAVAARLAAVLEDLEKHAESLTDADLEEDGRSSAQMSEKDYEALVLSRYREIRTWMFSTVLGWFRDLMALASAPRRVGVGNVEGGPAIPIVNEKFRDVLERRARALRLSDAFRNVEAVEDALRSMDSGLEEYAVLAFMMDRITMGTEQTGK